MNLQLTHPPNNKPVPLNNKLCARASVLPYIKMSKKNKTTLPLKMLHHQNIRINATLLWLIQIKFFRGIWLFNIGLWKYKYCFTPKAFQRMFIRALWLWKYQKTLSSCCWLASQLSRTHPDLVTHSNTGLIILQYYV